MTPVELWMPIMGASMYRISNQGRVLSLVKKNPKILSPIKMGRYIGVQLVNDDGNTRHHYIHRLVLIAFKGNPASGEHARHMNGNNKDNRVDNLCWGTPSQNNQDKVLHGTAPIGEKNPMAKLTRAIVEDMRAVHATGGLSFSQMGKKFGVSTMTAYRAIQGESWK